MKINQEELIEDLIKHTKGVLNNAEQYNQQSIEKLNYRTTPDSWSILECLEHLNLYGDFYLPEIKKRINSAKSNQVKIFKSGLLGNYFAKSMLPKEKLNKMKTFKDKNPLGSDLEKTVVERFINQQKIMLDLLNKAREVDLNKIKTAVSIASWIKLKLGDTFRVVVYHNQRHIVQANKIIELI